MSCQNAIKKILECPDACLADSTVAAKNKKTFRIESKNKTKFCRIDLDKVEVDYLIKHGHKNSDYIFISCKKKQSDEFYEAYYFVELKGVDVASAVKQIETTINNFRTKHKAPLERVSGYIVSSGVPGKANLKFQNEKERLRKQKIQLPLTATYQSPRS